MENTKNRTWVIDPTHSEIGFKVKHMMISSVSGSFSEFSAQVITDSEDFKNAAISFSAKTASIDTKNKDRDAHLQSDDFFNSEKYPSLSFKSTAFDGELLEGVLTIRDVSKPISLNVEFNGIAVDPYGQTKAGFEIQGEINRKDFNLTWSAVTEAGNIVVSDKIKLIIEAQFIQKG
jgi:polyisoprenoid-binding protein YceI